MINKTEQALDSVKHLDKACQMLDRSPSAALMASSPSGMPLSVFILHTIYVAVS